MTVGLVLVVVSACGGDNGDGRMATDDAASERDATPRDAALTSDADELDARPPDDANPARDADSLDAPSVPDGSPPDAATPPVDVGPAPDDGAPPPPSCTADRDCDDHALCNGAERCDRVLGCVAADPDTICEDHDPCTVLTSCDAVTDTCNHACNRFDPTCTDEPICLSDCVIDNDCNDGFFCSGRERCVGGTCRSGEPETCDDGDPCTIEIGCLRTADECVRECNTRNPSCDCGDAG